MKYNAYWMSPKGEILGTDTRHINDVLSNPSQFGLTLNYVYSVYKKHKEKIGQEGNAREELMIDLMKKGWVRVRKNKNGWIIQTYNLAKKIKDNIWDLAKHLVFKDKNSKYADVLVTAIHPDYYTSVNLEDILQGSLYESREYLSRKNKIYEVMSKLNGNVKLKKLIPESKDIKLVTETKLGKIWKYITDEDSIFGIISAYRIENSKEENEELSKQLFSDVRRKYGYIFLKGGFVEKGIEVIEESFFVPKISRDEIVQLGIKYKQYSVIHKDGKSFVEIGTSDDAGVGKVLNRFSVDERTGLSMSKEFIKNYFSSLLYGPHTGKKFVFKLAERESANFNRVAYNKNPLKWNTIFEEKFK